MNNLKNHMMMKSLALTLAIFGTTTSLAAAPAASVVLKGVDPAFYLQKRNHAPDVSAELKTLPLAVSLAVLKNPEAFLVDGGQAKEARVVERRALQQGALTALAQHAQKASDADVEVIGAALHAVYLESTDNAVRAVALERLGELPGAVDGRGIVDVLGPIANDAYEDEGVRAGAVAGLGRHRSEDAWRVLSTIVGDKAHPDVVRVAALHATANLTSRWAWQARHDVVTGARLRKEAAVVVAAVEGSADVVAARDEALRLLK